MQIIFSGLLYCVPRPADEDAVLAFLGEEFGSILTPTMVMHESDIGRTDPITLTQWILTQQQIKVTVRCLRSYFYTLSSTFPSFKNPLVYRVRLFYCLACLKICEMQSIYYLMLTGLVTMLQAPNARGNLSILLNAICVACKYVESAVRKVSLMRLYFLYMCKLALQLVHRALY